MRAYRIVVPSPLLDQNLGLLQRVEKFAVEQLVPEPAVERFHVAVLPRAAWLEDAEDLALIEERRDGPWVEWSDFRKDL